MRELVAAGLMIAAAAFLPVTASPSAAQSGEAVIAVVAPGGSIESSGEPAPFRIDVEGVTNLGAFEFVLAFDSGLFEFDHAEQGSFLGSTGREVVCDEPKSAPGAVRMLCVTLLREPEGPSGAGTLATVWLRPKGTGKAEVALSRSKLTSVSAAGLTARVESATVTIGGDGGDWLLIWSAVASGAVLAVAAGAVVVARMRRNQPRLADQ